MAYKGRSLQSEIIDQRIEGGSGYINPIKQVDTLEMRLIRHGVHIRYTVYGALIRMHLFECRF